MGRGGGGWVHAAGAVFEGNVTALLGEDCVREDFSLLADETVFEVSSTFGKGFLIDALVGYDVFLPLLASSVDIASGEPAVGVSSGSLSLSDGEGTRKVPVRLVIIGVFGETCCCVRLTDSSPVDCLL